jgi:hypothetical protein
MRGFTSSGTAVGKAKLPFKMLSRMNLRGLRGSQNGLRPAYCNELEKDVEAETVVSVQE